MKKYFIQQFLYSTAFMAALTGYNYASSGTSAPVAQSGVSNFTTLTLQTQELSGDTTTNTIQQEQQIPAVSQKSLCTLQDTNRTRMIQTWRLNEVQALMNASPMSKKMVVDSMYMMFEYVVRNTTGVQKTANDDGLQINLKELPVSTLRENFWGYPFYKIVLGLLHGADILSKNQSITRTEGTHSLIDYKNGTLTFHTLPTEEMLKKEPSQNAALELLIHYAKTDELKEWIIAFGKTELQKLERLMHLRRSTPQNFLHYNYIAPLDLTELKRLAESGWMPAQHYYAYLLLHGDFGAGKTGELKRLALQDKHKNKSPYVKAYIETFQTPLELLEFILEPTPTNDVTETNSVLTPETTPQYPSAAAYAGGAS